MLIESLKNELESLHQIRHKIFEILSRGDELITEANTSQSGRTLVCEVLSDCFRVYPSQSFDLLLRIDQKTAIELLIEFYLKSERSSVEYESDLHILLDDVKEILGEEFLRELVKNNVSVESRKNSVEIKNALKFALDLEKDSELPSWYFK